MKVAKIYIIITLIIIFSLLFVGVSFADFYEITSIGSALDSTTGENYRLVENDNNSYLSVFLTFLPVICLFIKKKWSNMISISASVLNLVTIVLLYPFFITEVESMIGSSHYVKLTGLGWIGTILVLLITFLLLIDMICKRKAYIGN